MSYENDTDSGNMVRAMLEIVEQLKRLNDKLDAISGFGVSETEHIRVVDMSRPPY